MLKSWELIWKQKEGEIQSFHGLRAIALFMVITTHYWDRSIIFPDHPKWIDHILEGFNSAIDIFFCLSGFLIYGIFQRNYEKFGRFQFQDFYKKRLLRTLPAYWIFLGFTALYFGSKPQYWELMSRFWNDLFFISNYKLGFHIITWSLSLEEQFYLVFPWVAILLFVKSKKEHRIWIQFVLWTLPTLIRLFGYFQLEEVTIQAYRERLYYPMHMHFGGFLVGMIVYEVYNQYRDPNTKSLNLSSNTYFGLLTIGLGSFLFQHLYFFDDSPIYYSVFRTAGLEFTYGVFMILGLDQGKIVDRILSHPFFTPFARISYGMYLWDIVFCAAVWRNLYGGSYTQKQTWIAAFFGYIIVHTLLFIWAAILYRFTEYPFLKIKDKNKTLITS